MKKLLSLFLVMIMVFSLSACASPENEKPEDSTPPVEDPVENDKDENQDEAEDIEDQDQDEEEVEQVEETKEAEVNIYFTSEEYVITGNEDLEKLQSEKRTVTYGDISLEESVMIELLKGPKDEELINSIPDSVKLEKVEVKDGTVYVDFAKAGMEGGSLEESLTINQIVTTLLELETVEQVQFLLNGEVTDSLMGHISTTEPFSEKP